MKRQLCQDQPQLVALLLPAALYALHPHNVTALLNEDSSLECPFTLQSQAIQVTCFEQSARWACKPLLISVHETSSFANWQPIPSCDFTWYLPAALLFHSMTPAGALEPKSLHASCPVISGTKWVVTKWLHTGEPPLWNVMLTTTQLLHHEWC